MSQSFTGILPVTTQKAGDLLVQNNTLDLFFDDHAETLISDRKQRTRVPGSFVTGDASMDTHMVSVACAEGMKAAITIHQELLTEDGVL